MKVPEHVDIARAVAFFQVCDDEALLMEQLRAIRPRAAVAVRRFQQRGQTVPPPANVPAAPLPASREEALATVRKTHDFALLQALARAIGKRVEELKDAAAPDEPSRGR